MSVFDGFTKPPCAETLGWELLEADEGNKPIVSDVERLVSGPFRTLAKSMIRPSLDYRLGRSWHPACV